MKRPIFRNTAILIAIGCVVAILAPLFFYNLSINHPYEGEIRIYGNVTQETIISLDEITGGDYLVVENRQFDILNRLNYTYAINYSGVSVWDLLDKLDILESNATSFRFVATDNYRSERIPLSLARDNPEGIIIGYKENGEYLRPKHLGGEGPMRSMVDLDVTQQMDPPTYNSQFWVKYVNGLEIE